MKGNEQTGESRKIGGKNKRLKNKMESKKRELRKKNIIINEASYE